MAPRRNDLNRARLLPAMLAAQFGIACGGACGGEAPPPAESPTATEALAVPEDYLGPIDPEWPPSHAADMDVELRAGALLMQHLADGGEIDSDEPLIEGEHVGVFAHESRIGDFDYIEVILGDVTTVDDELPLVVLLHGRGDRPRIPGQSPAGAPPVRLFIPRAPDRLGEHGFTWLATWTTSGNTELLARSLAGRVDELAPAIDAFAQLRPTRGKPILVGFSQGAIMSYGLVTRHPERFTAAFPVAGWLPEEMLPPVAPEGVTYPYVHAMHGTVDETVPFANGLATATALRERGFQVDWTPIPDVAHHVTHEMGQKVRSWVGDVALTLMAEPEGAVD